MLFLVGGALGWRPADQDCVGTACFERGGATDAMGVLVVQAKGQPCDAVSSDEMALAHRGRAVCFATCAEALLNEPTQDLLERVASVAAVMGEAFSFSDAVASPE